MFVRALGILLSIGTLFGYTKLCDVNETTYREVIAVLLLKFKDLGNRDAIMF